MISTLVLAAALCGQTAPSGAYYTRYDLAVRIAAMQRDAYYGSLQYQQDQYWARVQAAQAYQQNLLHPPVAPYVIGPGGVPLAGPNGQVTGYWTTANYPFPWGR
jgi:hypothetical protein